MRRIGTLVAVLLLLAVGCNKEAGDPPVDGEEPAAQGEQQPSSPTPGDEAQAPGETTPSPTTDTPPFEGIRDGFFESTRFNIRFQWPPTWTIASDTGSDSLSISGPDGLQMIVANSQSFQLADTNFERLDDRVSFENVNILPDRTEQRPINGLPGYRVEGDALLRGENVPVYFISQVVSLPGEPVVATVFIPGENYFEHSDAMKAVLDSIEALNLRPE